MTDWYAWVQGIALERIDQIERQLNSNPEAFPRFAVAARKVDAAMEQTKGQPDAAITARDDLWMSYSAALALEMYLAGARDGGRIYHAFVTGELHSIQKHEEDAHEQIDS